MALVRVRKRIKIQTEDFFDLGARYDAAYSLTVAYPTCMVGFGTATLSSVTSDGGTRSVVLSKPSGSWLRANQCVAAPVPAGQCDTYAGSFAVGDKLVATSLFGSGATEVVTLTFAADVKGCGLQIQPNALGTLYSVTIVAKNAAAVTLGTFVFGASPDTEEAATSTYLADNSTQFFGVGYDAGEAGDIRSVVITVENTDTAVIVAHAFNRLEIGPAIPDPVPVGEDSAAVVPIGEDTFESIAVIPHPDGDRDQVWVAVKRTIEDVETRYIEFFDDAGRYYDQLLLDSALTYDGIQSAAFLTLSAVSGSGVTATSSANTFTGDEVGEEIRLLGVGARARITAITSTTTATVTVLSDFPHTGPYLGGWGVTASVFTGLDHLEGRVVETIGDGAPLPDHTVEDGTITHTVHVLQAEVGLGYVATLTTVRPEGHPAGSSQGLQKRWAEAILRFADTVGGEINGIEIPWRTGEEPMAGPPQRLTGDQKVHFPAGYDTDGRITVQQRKGLPMTVLLLAGVLTTGD